MILTDADTLLSLEEFRTIVRFHPFHFWGLADNDLVPVTSSCNDLIYEDDWQNAEAISRQSLREAIARAEVKLADYLGYEVAPRYREHTMPYPPLADQERLSRAYPIDSRDRMTSLRLPFGHVQSIGARVSTYLGTAAVSYRDTDRDGIDDTFVLLFDTDVTSAEQIAVYISAADRYDAMLPMASYRVRPIAVTIADGQATITGRAWCAVRPELYGQIAGVAQGIDPTDPDTFVGTLDVYREYINPDGITVDDCQATLIWEVNPYPLWASRWTGSATSPYAPNASDPAALGMAVARCGIRSNALGIITPVEAARDSDTGEWSQVRWATGYEPDRVLIRALAGLHTVDRTMRRVWQQTTVYLALAELEGPICACESVSKRLHHWQFDLARTSGDENYGAISRNDLDNPFGTRRGHVEAWKRVSQARLTPGIAI